MATLRMALLRSASCSACRVSSNSSSRFARQALACSASAGVSVPSTRARRQVSVVATRQPSAAPSIHDLPTSARYRGEELNRRIHRLLGPPAAVAAPARRLRYLIALAFTTPILAVRPIHDLVEAAVTWLP